MSKSLIGQPAPDFTIPSSSGEPFSLSSLTGKGVPVALFFFPKAGTSVCDAEACSFESTFPKIEGTPTLHVVGVSYTSPEELATWKENKKISYDILSDEKRQARDAFKVGKALMGMSEARATFYINKEGKVEGVLDGNLNIGSSKKHVDFIKKLHDQGK